MNDQSKQSGVRERLISDLFLLLAAAIWGGGFVAQRFATLHMGFFAFNGIRFLLAGLSLLPFVLKRFGNIRKTYGWILISGVILFLASSLQQAGLETTTASAAGFITGVYVLLVPVFLSIFWKKRSAPIIWIAAFVALGGTYLLSTGGARLDPSTGDLLVLTGAFLWALHVIIVGIAVQKLDVFAFSAGQFLVSAFLHLVLSLFIDPLTISALRVSWLALAYAGFFSAALGFTFQAIGQRKAPAADAALILSLEAVFAALSGFAFLHETLNWVQILGCVIIMVAILIAQLVVTRRKVEE